MKGTRAYGRRLALVVCYVRTVFGAVVLLSCRRCFARDVDSVNMRATFYAVLLGSFVVRVTFHLPILPRSRMSSGC